MFRHKPQITCLLITICASLCSGANILALFPLPVYSHTQGYIMVMEELARRGHNVTVVSPYPRMEPMANYTDVFIPIEFDEIREIGKKMGYYNEDPHNSMFLSNVKGLGRYCPVFEEAFLKVPALMSFIREDRSHFDVVITESFHCQEILTALSYKYSAHLIGVTAFDIGALEAYYTGSTIPYSYIPHVKTNFTDSMSFQERLDNSISHLSELISNLFYYNFRKEKVMREHIKFPGSENLPLLDDILRNHTLLLVDRHYSLSHPRPYHQNIVEFGGPSLKKSEPLPKDLEEFMSESKDGVILFSMGSHYNATYLGETALIKFLRVFSRLRQRVLMRWEISEPDGLPDNVRIGHWFPQASILAHPKLVAFISHCGYHSLSEATYFGVPILGIPVFSDQFHNTKLAEKYGYVIFLDVETFSEKTLMKSINKLIYNPSYKQAALRQSAIMKDRPLPPLDNAVYWIEYVIRHNGAKHLRPASLDLYWFQYLLLDVIIYVCGVLVLLVGSACALFKRCTERLFIPHMMGNRI